MTYFQGTEYIVASNSGQYRDCHNFLRSNKVKDVNLTWPTIMAKREDEVVGVMGTLKSDKAVIAGPVYVSIPNSMVPFRLIETYERFLKSQGIKKFIFSVDTDNHKWLNMIERAGVYKRTGLKNHSIWFERELQ